MTILTFTFKQALESLTEGAVVTLRSQDLAPSEEQLEPYRLWQARNFTGEVVGISSEQIDIEKQTEGGIVITHLKEDYDGFFDVDSSQLTVTPQVDAILVQKIVEKQEEQETLDEGSSFRRMVALMTWMELQDFRANSTVILAMTAAARAERIPFLQALKLETGLSWAALETAVVNRIWPIVRRTALFEAQAVVAKENLNNATTLEDKITATEVVFQEN